MVKNQPSSTSASACTQNLHYAHSGFWPILAYFCPKVLRFFWTHFFSFEHINMKFSGMNQQCRKNIWAKKSCELTPITCFLAKNVPRGVQKWIKKFRLFLSKGRLNLWARYSKPRKKLKFFFLPIGKPSCKKSAVFFNIVQKAVAPPPHLFEHYVVIFSEGILTKVRKRLLQQLSTK